MSFRRRCSLPQEQALSPEASATDSGTISLMGTVRTVPKKRLPRRRPYLPTRRLLTCDEFEQLVDSGVFLPEERLELIAGELVQREVPVKSTHATAVRLVENALRNIFQEGYDVRGQLSLRLSEYDEPLPDVAVVIGSPRNYTHQHPTSALLVVEVSETTLKMDRETKGSLYASAGIPEYWLLNLPERVLEVYRNPVPMPRRAFGHGYQIVLKMGEHETLSPLSAPNATLRVADLMP